MAKLQRVKKIAKVKRATSTKVLASKGAVRRKLNPEVKKKGCPKGTKRPEKIIETPPVLDRAIKPAPVQMRYVFSYGPYTG